jgi:hypothetical protein
MSEGSSRASSAMARTAAIFISSLMVRRAAIERAAEDVRKTQDVVDLIGKIRPPGADHRVGPGFAASSGMISGEGLASAMISGFPPSP